MGVAVITDVGEKDDIHPKRKEPVGARLALAARSIAYRQPVEWSGPSYRGMKISGDRIILRFDHARSGLEARGGDLTGFAICGADRRFVWARAALAGDRVVVSSPEVARPVEGGDAFFPPFDRGAWREVRREAGATPGVTFVDLER